MRHKSTKYSRQKETKEQISQEVFLFLSNINKTLIMKFRFYFITLAILLFAFPLKSQQSPKREFRGAWIQTVHQSQYQNMDKATMQTYLTAMLDGLQQMGINAVIFQVRPQADAFYRSSLEPWSRFFTGTQGIAPTPIWDPMQYLIEACHERNMEFHAWLNPYRVKSNLNEQLAPGHIYHKHPEWFVTYGNQLYFDPGLPESRKFICQVVDDIVSRYDIDAIHMDDYFYPYPIAGKEFPDQKSFARYGNGLSLSDWRRNNVNFLIQELHQTISQRKPWVRFGISPFGIYRNKKNDTNGSDTNGLQNYDDLYADVLMWTRNGWVDYMMPQLYWEIGHKAACYETLIYWWNRHGNGRHLYIGQDVKRTMNAADVNPKYSQLNHKIQLSRYLDNISGNCFWPAHPLLENYGNIGNALKYDHFAFPAIIPAYTFIDDKCPAEVKSLKARWIPQGYVLEWKRKNTKDEMQKQVYFCIYRFAEGEPIDLSNGKNLVTTTRETGYLLPYQKGTEKYTYVITAVDRMHNESKKGKKVTVKL